MLHIDHNSRQPVYQQLYEQIKHDILKGKLPVGTKITSSSARMVHIAPSHQFPMGAVMPIYKRIQLLNWAQERENIIIEDDYDSEFRYNGRPIPSLQSIQE